MFLDLTAGEIQDWLDFSPAARKHRASASNGRIFMQLEGTFSVVNRYRIPEPSEPRAADQDRCSRRATRVIVRPLLKMEKCSIVQAISAKPARG